MNKPVLNEWVWNIPFYPCSSDKARTVKSIFWYNSSNVLEFSSFKDEYQILVPESLIIGSDADKRTVRMNLDYIWKNKIQVILQKGDSWVLTLPDQLIVSSFLSI